MISLDLLIDLIGFCNCSKIYSWRGLRKHKFCWFGCLEGQIEYAVCLFSLQPAFTVYVWLCVFVGFVLALFVNKSFVAVFCLLWSLICLIAMLSACNTYHSTQLHLDFQYLFWWCLLLVRQNRFWESYFLKSPYPWAHLHVMEMLRF